MRTFNTLFGTLAGTALTIMCVQVNAETTGNGFPAMASDATAVIMLAENSTTARDSNAEPALGGEGDGAVGGNAPESDRSAATMLDDGKITAEVKAKLLADTKVSGLKIDVDTRNGVVYLTGDNIKDQTAMDQAVRLARGTFGVKDVVSKLAVADIKR